MRSRKTRMPFCHDLKDGKVDLNSNAKWNSLMDFFDVM